MMNKIRLGLGWVSDINEAYYIASTLTRKYHMEVIAEQIPEKGKYNLVYVYLPSEFDNMKSIKATTFIQGYKFAKGDKGAAKFDSDYSETSFNNSDEYKRKTL